MTKRSQRSIISYAPVALDGAKCEFPGGIPIDHRGPAVSVSMTMRGD